MGGKANRVFLANSTRKGRTDMTFGEKSIPSIWGKAFLDLQGEEETHVVGTTQRRKVSFE